MKNMKTLEKIGNRTSVRLHDHSTMVLHITVVLLILFIILTRISGLTYNMFLHPDEWVFYRGSSSLARAILSSETAFTEVKEYPEGTYLFQAPFHLLKILVAFLSGIPQNDQIWGRISSVFYFVLAIIVGIRILIQFWGRNKAACIIYSLTMCFSVFFIEHSRYGVGDMCSLFLMMLILYFTALALASTKQYCFALACMASGAMGAVKYPQLFFVVIPLCAYLFTSEHRKSKKIVVFCLLILSTACTVLFFSPKALLDPHYFLRVIEREANAYVMKGTTFEDGGILNHLVGMVLFTLLYSDFPLSFVFVSYSFYCLLKEPIDKTKPTDLLFCKIVPIMCIVFFIYNLFAKLLVFRTYTPYFGITILYCSQFVAKLFHKRWKGFAIAAALTFIMILRGGGAHSNYLLTECNKCKLFCQNCFCC